MSDRADGTPTDGFRPEEFRTGSVPKQQGREQAERKQQEQKQQEHKRPHAGNGTVNHGPDDQSLDGLDSEELALRRMLHQAVGAIEPTDAVLDHLRRAVPARRARKRHAAIGMAAAALFIGTAVPALLHVSNVTGSDRSVNAGHGSQAGDDEDKGKGPDGGESTSGGDSGTVGDGPKTTPSASPTGPDTNSGSTGTTGSTDTAPSSGTAPVCDAAQLGSATGSTNGADTTGVTYGTFRVVNVSSTSCTVGGNGSVSTFVAGAADSAKVSTSDHTAGDAAGGLPDPSLSVSGLVLAPGAAYQVQFAWVPTETCPTTDDGTTDGGTGDGGTTDGGTTGGSTASPTPTPTESTDSSTTAAVGDTGTTAQLLTDGGTADGSVTVSYTAEAGSPTVSATVSNACAGTVYKTGVMAETT